MDPLRAAGPVGGLTTDFAGAVPFGYGDDTVMPTLDDWAAGPVGIFCGRVDDGGGGADEVVGVDSCWLTGVDVPDPDDVVFPTAYKTHVRNKVKSIYIFTCA
jgi:hypothetical protein